MNKDGIPGAGKQRIGDLRTFIRDVAGDAKLWVEGRSEHVTVKL